MTKDIEELNKKNTMQLAKHLGCNEEELWSNLKPIYNEMYESGIKLGKAQFYLMAIQCEIKGLTFKRFLDTYSAMVILKEEDE